MFNVKRGHSIYLSDMKIASDVDRGRRVILPHLPSNAGCGLMNLIPPVPANPIGVTLIIHLTYANFQLNIASKIYIQIDVFYYFNLYL